MGTMMVSRRTTPHARAGLRAWPLAARWASAAAVVEIAKKPRRLRSEDRHRDRDGDTSKQFAAFSRGSIDDEFRGVRSHNQAVVTITRGRLFIRSLMKAVASKATSAVLVGASSIWDCRGAALQPVHPGSRVPPRFAVVSPAPYEVSGCMPTRFTGVHGLDDEREGHGIDACPVSCVWPRRLMGASFSGDSGRTIRAG